MTAAAMPLPRPAPRHLWALLLGLCLMVAGGFNKGGDFTKGGLGESTPARGGCDPATGGKVGCVAVGGGGLVAFRGLRHCDEAAQLGGMAVRQGDELGGIGARLGDDALGAGAHGLDGTRHLDGVGHLADDLWRVQVDGLGRIAVDGGADLGEYGLTLARHPEIAGKLDDAAALSRYAEAHPGFYQDLGVEMYLRDPDTYGALLQVERTVSTLSPAFRARARGQVAQRMGSAVKELAEVPAEELSGKAGAIAGKYGLEARMVDDAVELTTSTREARWTSRLALDALQLALRSGQTAQVVGEEGAPLPVEGPAPAEASPEWTVVEECLDETAWPE